MDRQSVLGNISGLKAEANEGSAYTIHRYLSQGDQRASGIRLLALLTFLPSFEGKCSDLTGSFIDLNTNGDDLGRTLEGFLHHLLCWSRPYNAEKRDSKPKDHDRSKRSNLL